MKIISGKFKGRNFYMPKGIRPTQSFVVKSLFDMLGQDLEDIVLLDMFAGSGAIGLEALSRNAARVTFIEKNAKCSEVIDDNIRLLTADGCNKFTGYCQMVNSDAFATVKVLAKKEQTFDIVFVDPPYGRELAKKSLKTLEAYDILHPNSLVVVQHEKHEILPKETGRFSCFRQKKYGATYLTIYKVKSQTSADQ